MPLDTTVNKKGDKSVTIRTGGNEKQRCTVMLCITADGIKLLPYVILKRKRIPKVDIKGVIVQAQEAGWMDLSLVVDWIKRVWQRHSGALQNLNSMVVLDSFRGHMTEGVKTLLKKGKTDLVAIPSGLMSMLQPFDVCIN